MQLTVPPEIETVASLPSPDYRDIHAVTVSARQPVTPEDWARRVFEGAPAPVRWFLRFGWKLGLGLRLGPRHSPQHILGWPIGATGPNWVLIEQASRILTARQVFWLNNPDQLAQATFVRYERPLASWIWPPVSVIHKRMIPYLLGRARRTVAHQDASQ